MPRWLESREDKRFFYALREHPLEMLIAVACVVGSISSLVASSAPNSIKALLTPPFQLLWNVNLLIGGLLILYGLSRSTATMQVRGTPVEKAGLTVVGTGTLVYGIAILSTVGYTSPFFVCMMFMLPVAFFLRVRQIDRLVKSNARMAARAKFDAGVIGVDDA